MLLESSSQTPGQTLSQTKRLEWQIVEALAVALSSKDDVTGEHVRRVQVYAEGVARLLGCSEMEIEALRAGSLLHDLGKLGIPDYILHKPGKLTADEFANMKRHTVIGAQILSRLELSFPVVPVVRHHHERWDGGGYPDGLKGQDIPLTARILTVVDCFDAVREDRPYRKGMTRQQAINLLQKDAGSFYDPQVVNTFVANLHQFEAQIAREEERGELGSINFGVEEELSVHALAVEPAAGLSGSANFQEVAEKLAFSLAEVKKLCDLSRKLDAAVDQFTLTTTFADGLRELLPYDSCIVTQLDRASGQIDVACARGDHRTDQRLREISMGERVTGWVIENMKPVINSDPKLDFEEQLLPLFGNYQTMAVVPFGEVSGAVRGAVSLYSSNLKAYTAAQEMMLKEAVSLYGSVMQNLISTPEGNLATSRAFTLSSPIYPPKNENAVDALMDQYSAEYLEKLYGGWDDGGPSGAGDNEIVLV